MAIDGVGFDSKETLQAFIDRIKGKFDDTPHIVSGLVSTEAKLEALFVSGELKDGAYPSVLIRIGDISLPGFTGGTVTIPTNNRGKILYLVRQKKDSGGFAYTGFTLSTEQTGDIPNNTQYSVEITKFSTEGTVIVSAQRMGSVYSVEVANLSQIKSSLLSAAAGNSTVAVLVDNDSEAVPVTFDNNVTISENFTLWFAWEIVITPQGGSGGGRGLIVTTSGKIYTADIVFNGFSSVTVNVYDDYLGKSAAQTQFMSSPATFVVNSDETLAAWAAHTAGNDYSSVYIASGTYTLASGGINLTAAGTKQVEGHPSSKLVFEALTPVDGNYSAALYYTSRPTDPTYNIKNVNVECTGAPATNANNYPCAFRNCVNLTNCSGYAKATGTKAYQAAYAFYGCQNLSFCFGASSGANNGNAYTFAASSYLTNCTADETAYPAAYDSKADIIPYASCSYLVNCVSKAKNGYELTRGFFGCSYLTGCHAEMTQDASTTVTEISGFNRCSRISNCHAKITDNSGKTLTNIGGFINSTMIDNCTSEGGQIYNSSYVAKCNATAYTQSYSDNYVTAAADTAAGGWNHTGILTWKNNRWENA